MTLPTIETGVCQTLQGLEDAWNRHDIQEYTAYLTEDCEWVNIVGMHWKGRAAVEKALDFYHRAIFRAMSLRTESMDVREVAPGVAVAVCAIRADAFAAPDGRTMPAALNRLTHVLVERDGRWLVASAQNTVVDPVAAPHDPARR